MKFIPSPMLTMHFNQDSGRWTINVKGHPLFPKRRWVNHARYVMALHLGRPLLASEEVHHKDHNKLNDCIDNLELLTKKEHALRHHTR